MNAITLDDLERDLERTFEGFRTTPPQHYQSQTPTVSKMAAEQFTRRFEAWAKLYCHKQVIEAELKARIDELNLLDTFFSENEYAYQEWDTIIRERIEELRKTL